MKIPFSIIFLIFALPLFSQTQKDYQKAAKFILKNDLDSASFYTNRLKENSDKKNLKNLITNKNLTYSDFYQFMSNLSKRQNINYLDVLEYINNSLIDPIKPHKINVDYFNTKWILITKLMDDAHLEQANLEQTKLENYINLFSKKDKNYAWAKTKLKTYPVLIYFIEKEIKIGKRLNLDCIEKSRELGDADLEITFMYFLLNYLVYEEKLNEYIAICENSLKLQKQIPEKNFFYYQIIVNVLNAYIYKGGYDEKVFVLIDELYNSHSRVHSYQLYAQLVSTIDKDSKLLQTIFNKFEVNNVLQFTEKLEKIGKVLNSNDYTGLINMCSRALQKHKYYNEALQYKHKVVELTRKIYSEELSASLANFEIDKAIKMKEKEIKSEKEQTKLYLIIVILCCFLLVISFISIKKLRKQSNELTQKNKLIKKSLDEKDLLIKEMHHRIKNNFQLITSLLDLQADEVDDNEVIQLLEKGKNRIKSMSLIHQKLYRNKSGLIKFDEFINLLVNELASLYKQDETLKLDISVNEIYFDVDTAIPLALILNELITNSFKYGLNNTTNNVLHISLVKTSNEKYRLIVKDNGPGIYQNFNLRKAKSSGLKLVVRLVKQLQGNINITNQEGARFEIVFKDTIKRKEVM